MNIGGQWSRVVVLFLLLVPAYPVAATASGHRPARQVSHLTALFITISESADPVYIGDDVVYTISLSYLDSNEDGPSRRANVHIGIVNGTITRADGCAFSDVGASCNLGEYVGAGSAVLFVTVKATGETPMALTVLSDAFSGFTWKTETTTVLPCSDAVPLQITPEDGVAGIGTTGMLSWNPVDRGNYTVYLGPAGSGCSTIFGSTPATFIQYLLDANTRYEWRVEASTIPDCPSTSTTCQTFTTGNDCALTPALIEPIGGARVTSPITFQWATVPEATGYSIFLSNGDAPFVPFGTTTGTSFTATLPILGRSRWYVAATVAGCSNVRSDIASFEAIPGRKRRSAR